jgi:ribonuclease BN (tRNA processing enzyme)
MTQLIFLGTGGGRIATVLQPRATGGIVLRTGSHQVYIDPGPGAAIRSKQHGIDIRETDLICLSHCHFDHTTDVCVIAEGMGNFGREEKGVLIMNETCSEKSSAVMPEYYYDYFKKKLVLSPGDNVDLGSLKISAMRCKHSDPKCIGFIFRTPKHRIGYTSDTEYFEGLSALYNGCDVIIFNVLRPGKDRISWHLCTEDVIKVVNEMEKKPRLILMSHFGMKMLKSNPLLEARKIFAETNIPVAAMSDGQKIDVESVLNTKKLLDF